jgi:hypothetical protein
VSGYGGAHGGGACYKEEIRKFGVDEPHDLDHYGKIL